jgi:hypothetical protein
VYHSATDLETVARLLPAMAGWNFERPPPAFPAPAVTGPDSAVLPLADGRVLHFTLAGPEVPCLGARQRAAWDRVVTAFGRPARAPRAVQGVSLLQLQAGAVTLRLGIPDGASVTALVEDRAPFRRARLYSLVVNNRGESCAEELVVNDLEGRSLMDKAPCGIEIIPGAGGGPDAGDGAGRPGRAESVGTLAEGAISPCRADGE